MSAELYVPARKGLECTVVLKAKDRRDLNTLITARKELECGWDAVTVEFEDGSPEVVYTPADLPALYQKLVYSV